MSDLKLFADWKGYPLPALNADGQFDSEPLHREWVAFRAGLARRTQPEATAPAQKLTLENAPIGTKAPATMGGAWTRTELGWKWDGGSTFPRPGGDWNGDLIAPAQDLSAAILALPIPTHWMAHQAVVMGYMAALKDAAALASSANALSAGDRVDALAVEMAKGYESGTFMSAMDDGGSVIRLHYQSSDEAQSAFDAISTAIDAAIIQSQKGDHAE